MGAPTHKVWFYQLNPGRNMGKTNPLGDDDMVDFIERQKTFADSAQSWSVDVAGVDAATFDLSVKNPNGGGEVALRTPQDILDEIAALDAESAEVLATIRGLESKDQSPEGVRLVQTGNVGEGEFKDRAEKARFVSQETFKRLRCTEIFAGDCSSASSSRRWHRRRPLKDCASSPRRMSRRVSSRPR